MINEENINTIEETKQTEQIINGVPANAQDQVKRNADIRDAIYEELLDLEMLPDLIQLFIDAYNMDSLNFTNTDAENLGGSRKKLYSLLVTLQRRLWAINENLQKILEE